MMGELKAIPTWHAGHKFRSRLEARWAVFFDFIGLRWEYEKEAFALVVDGKKTGYTPDFWLPSLGMWFEVKAEWSSYAEDEQRALVHKTVEFFRGVPDRFVIGLGPLRDECIWELLRDDQGNITEVAEDRRWCRCAECFAWGFDVDDFCDRPCGHNSLGIGREQAKGALLDATAFRFWDPK